MDIGSYPEGGKPASWRVLKVKGTKDFETTKNDFGTLIFYCGAKLLNGNY